jgi:hypothetical protein
MGKTQPEKLQRPEDVSQSIDFGEEPNRPIEVSLGEVAVMQALVASRMSHNRNHPAYRVDDAGSFETAVSTVSRLAGYISMGAALTALAYLVF